MFTDTYWQNHQKYTAAVKSSSLDDTAKSLSALNEVFKKDSRLPTLISAPTLTATDKSQIVAELQKHMGGLDKGKTVQNFLNTMADNNRLGVLEGVCEKFSTLMEAARGEIELVITSAAVSLEERWDKGRGCWWDQY